MLSKNGPIVFLCIFFAVRTYIQLTKGSIKETKQEAIKDRYPEEDRQLKMMKAALPYLANDSKPMISSVIRIMEIRNTLKKLDQEEEELLTSCSVTSEEDREYGLFQALREFCSPREQEMIDMIVNVTQFSRMYREMDFEHMDGGNEQ